MPSERIPDEIMREAERLAYNCHPTEIARALMARDKRAAEIANRAEAWHTNEVIARAILTYGGRDAE